MTFWKEAFFIQELHHTFCR